MKTFIRFLLRLLFRFRAFNEEALNAPGPVLLIPNHVSWFDWAFLLGCLDGEWRFVTSSTVAEKSPVHRFLMKNRHTFPIDTASPYAVKKMAEYLQTGGRLVLFAEGQITYTGSLMKLFDGTGFLIHKTNPRVITCYLRGANRLRFSRQPGWRRWLPEVTAHFSEAIQAPALTDISATVARQKLTNWLRDRMLAQQFETEMQLGPATVLDAVIDAARRQPGKVILHDATDAELTYRRVLAGADLLAQQFRSRLQAEPEHVGVLLPNVNATPVTLLALWALGKVPAILNFSTGPAVMLACAQLAGLRQIITSRAFLEKAKLDIKPLIAAGIEFIHLEDLRAGISSSDKFLTLLRVSLLPDSLANQPPLRDAPRAGAPSIARPDGDDVASSQAMLGAPKHAGTAGSETGAPPRAASPTAVVLFTSGSEGVPKGVELTHANILANIRQMLAVTDIEDGDRMFNALPLFHSFGLVVGMLLPLVRGFYTFLYPSPLHYRIVPSILYGTNCTIFLSTNTFLNGYARKAHPYDFRKMRYLFAAAEKVQETTYANWSHKYGVRLLEGYGATECSPCISVNTPLAPRSGSVGKLLPGLEYKLDPVEGVGSDPAPNEHDSPSPISHLPSPNSVGRLFVRGPNVMRGYLNADANAKFLALGGWYDTGDIVRVDEDGYLYVLGRLKRFAKVSGEMVSLTAVEDALAGAFPHYGLRCQVAVLARPDHDKGEVLIAVTNEPKLTAEEIRAAVKAKGLTNLCVPREIKLVHEIPKLGTGKVNHRELQKLIA
jgi:acyl-[acyl-carrier-protein]-phospholipid O-acyltransferase/long-chain-fatty-acid--[acyl-carrier-protein] ligase